MRTWTGLELHPSQNEARSMLIAVILFWTLIATMMFARETPGLVPVFLLGLFSGFWFYVVLFRIGGRATNRSWWEFLLPIRGYFTTARDAFRLLLSLLDLHFWGGLVRASGWNPAVVTTLLIGSLAASLLGVLFGATYVSL